MKLNQKFIHPETPELKGYVQYREAVRAIVKRGEELLLLYTERYNDFSFPGGGMHENETKEEAVVRELKEETGAQNIQIKEYLGVLEEYRPHYKPTIDVVHMISHVFICEISEELQEPQFEEHEIKNKMSVVWKNLQEVIQHNEQVMAKQEKSMGLSIGRETWLMKYIT